MDLRQFRATPTQVEAAAQHLRYQPFVLDDDRHTGVGYSWLYTKDPTTAANQDFLFDRRVISADMWNKAYDANRRLAAMYDGFIERIVDICPTGGAYLDVGCNTGYFPVKASLSGIRTTAGIDLGDYTNAFQLLNEITGASAKFSVGSHDPLSHTIRIKENLGVKKFDVVSTSQVLCHLPDPLHFLTAIARLASKGVFMWNNLLETDELLIHYNPPNKFTNAEFPNGFDEGTSISVGLLLLAMSKLGFTHHEELKIKPEWMPEEWIRPAHLHAFLFWR
jgi:SAM-dependent methyltransferase